MAAERQPLILKGGAVFDSDRRTFVTSDLRCRDGRIELFAAGEAPDDGRLLDCAGKFILPGLIDAHVHLTSSGAAGEMNLAKTLSLPVRAWRAREYARATLHAGITTVRDLGAADRLNIEMASAVESGLIEGPRIVAAGMGVTMTGGHGHGFMAREADGPDEVRRAVREELRAGARAVKLFASGGVMTPGVDPRSPSLTEEELRAAVEEGHKAFRPVAAHAQATEGIKNAVRAGVDSIEHGVWLDDEAVELMCERGTYLVATLTAPHHIAKGGKEAGIPDYMVDKAHQVMADHIASFRAAVKAGVRVAMGTDQGTPLNHPGENAQEIVRMAEHGLSNGAAIMAATQWAAELLRVDNVCGSIRPGLAADLVVVDADPLADIAVLTRMENIVAVVQDGRVVREGGGMTDGGIG
ncbi:MAG TPA: amidohydrolase family protein [Tepidiformaceae bacterium]